MGRVFISHFRMHGPVEQSFHILAGFLPAEGNHHSHRQTCSKTGNDFIDTGGRQADQPQNIHDGTGNDPGGGSGKGQPLPEQAQDVNVNEFL